QFDLGDPTKAFCYRERMAESDFRSSGATQGHTICSEPSCSALGSSQLAGRTIIEYAVLEDRVIGWAISSEGLRQVVEVRDVKRLRRYSKALRSSILRYAPAEMTYPLASQLYSDLLGNLLQGFPRGTRIVVVPDEFLASLPFAALRRSGTGRYLIQDYGLSVAFSASSYLRSFKRARSYRGISGKALLVGGPESSSRDMGLPRLLRSEQELREIGHNYQEARILLDGNATRQNFLQEAIGSKLIQFSGHAVANSVDPPRSYLVLSP